MLECKGSRLLDWIQKKFNARDIVWFNTRFSALAKREMHVGQLGDVVFRSWEWNTINSKDSRQMDCNFFISS